MDLGTKIKTLLSNNDMTQKDLAERMHVQPTTVQKWCSGINSPDIFTIKELCNIFSIPVQDLLNDDFDIVEFYTIDRYLPYSQDRFPVEMQDSEHIIIDANLKRGARLHRFTNCAGDKCSAIYIGSTEKWWDYREGESRMINDWNHMYNDQ